jgi:general nucleoside transport system ATP-binding protein
MELLSLRGVSKYFRETQTLADDRVSLSLAEGETKAVVGENGAGKSTLARIIAGLVAQDSGEVLIRGRRLRPGSVREAEAAGIGFVPQTSLLAGDLSVAENLVLGREPRSLGLLLSRRKAYVETALLVERFGFRLDPDAPVSSLTAAERRQAEIARALARGGELIVLDEPTSILSECETGRLFELLARVARAGKGILLITHRLSEVLKVADTITVLREGAVVADLAATAADEAELAALMARRHVAGTRHSVRELSPEARLEAGAVGPVFEIRNLSLAPGAKPLSLSIRPGEVLAVTALAGNGLGALEDQASGMEAPSGGEILLRGRSLATIPRQELRSELLAYAPSDREGRGLCLPAAMRENILVLRRGEFPPIDWLGKGRRDGAAAEAAEALGLAADPRQSAASLSGGNRQRLLLARELDRPRPLLLLAEALQGLDLASQEEAANLIRELAARGSAILLLASHVEEVLGAADRVIALYRGEAVFEGPNEGAATAQSLLAAMTGAGQGSAA